MRGLKKGGWAPWLVMAVVLAVALAIGAGHGGGRPSETQRVHRIAASLRCPTCRSQSVADSDAEAARSARDEIRDRVRAGQTDAQIRGYFVSRFGSDILLKPEGKGVALWVWALPVIGLVCTVAGLTVAFRRWRARPGASVSADDRALVERALGP